jgi:hypothetical protein
MQNDEAQKALSLANVTNRVRFNSSWKRPQGRHQRARPLVGALRALRADASQCSSHHGRAASKDDRSQAA